MRWLVAHDAAAESLAHALMTETHAEDGHLAAKLADRVRRHSSVIGRSWPRRDDDAVVLTQLLHSHLVVAEHARLHAELTQALHQVVGEAVEVVDDRDRHLHALRHLDG